MHLSTLELPYIRHLPKLKSREMRSSIGKLRAMRLLNNSQQVRWLRPGLRLRTS